jgi:hypothetical protein
MGIAGGSGGVINIGLILLDKCVGRIVFCGCALMFLCFILPIVLLYHIHLSTFVASHPSSRSDDDSPFLVTHFHRHKLSGVFSNVSIISLFASWFHCRPRHGRFFDGRIGVATQDLSATPKSGTSIPKLEFRKMQTHRGRRKVDGAKDMDLGIVWLGLDARA